MPPASSFLEKNKSLQYPIFRYFLLLRFTIILSLNMQATIISYFAYKLTGDPLVLGMLGLWEVIPAIGFSLFSGHFVDLLEKTQLLFWCVAGYIALTAFYIFLAWPHFMAHTATHGLVWLLYAGIFIGGALRAFISPASFALQGLLIPRDLYPNATTWSSTSWQTGALLGPLAGGVLCAYGFQHSLFWVLGVELLAFFAILRIPKQPILKKIKEPVIKSLGEGIKFVFRTQLVLAALSLDMFAVLFGGATALLPIYATDILHVGAIGYGWMRSAPAIGSVLTLAILSFLPLNKKPGIKLMLAITGFGVTTIIFGYCGYFGTGFFTSVLGMGVSWGFIIAFMMLLIGGMFDAVSVVIRSTILQVYTPDSMRGRVAAVNTMFISSSNELGAMESGLTARWMGTVPAVVFGGFMTLVVVGVTYFAAPRLRKLSLQGDEKKESAE